ncbi:hypothetical protein FF2_020865 [Malus domestica]
MKVLERGMKGLNQAEVGTGLQVYYNLGKLRQAIDQLINKYKGMRMKSVSAALDMKAISGLGGSRFRSGGIKGGGGTPQIGDGGKAREAIWQRMGSCMDQLHSIMVAVWHLQRVLSKKRDPFAHVSLLDEVIQSQARLSPRHPIPLNYNLLHHWLPSTCNSKTFKLLRFGSTMVTPSPPLTICTVLNESKRMVNAHSCHFLALSVLFLLPLTFSSTVYPTIQNLLADRVPDNSKIFLEISSFDPHQLQPIIAAKTLLIAFAFSLFAVVFSLCALGSIT